VNRRYGIWIEYLYRSVDSGVSERTETLSALETLLTSAGQAGDTIKPSKAKQKRFLDKGEGRSLCALQIT